MIDYDNALELSAFADSERMYQIMRSPDGYLTDIRDIGEYSWEISPSLEDSVADKAARKYPIGWTVDAAGNITEDDDFVAEYDEQNRLTVLNGQSVEYDADGNALEAVVDGEIISLSYDQHNRLVGIEETSLSYNTVGDLASKEDASGLTSFVYDCAGESNALLASMDSAGTTKYVWGMGPVGQENPDGSYRAYHFDPWGNLVALTDAGGRVTDRYSYSVWGEAACELGSLSSTPFLYGGRDGVTCDTASGLLFMRARWYSPGVRRFVSADRVAPDALSAAAANLYLYANGNPLMYVDPYGRSASLVAGGHAVLDAAGLIPVAGMVFDAANGIWYAAEGDWGNAALSAVALVPVLGDAAAVGKAGVKAVGAAADAVRAGSKVNANDLNHIFGKPGHNLDGYLRSFGGDEEKAYLALEKAVDEYVRANDITSYTDGITVNVMATI